MSELVSEAAKLVSFVNYNGTPIFLMVSKSILAIRSWVIRRAFVGGA